MTGWLSRRHWAVPALAFLLQYMAPEAIADGRLRRVLEDWCAPFPGVYLYYPSRRQMRPALRAFIDFFRHPVDMTL